MAAPIAAIQAGVWGVESFGVADSTANATGEGAVAVVVAEGDALAGAVGLAEGLLGSANSGMAGAGTTGATGVVAGTLGFAEGGLGDAERTDWPGHSVAGKPAMPQINPLLWKRSSATCCSTCRPVALSGAVRHCTEVAGGVSPTGAIPAGP